MTDLTLGPPLIYVPVVRHPKDYPQRAQGPIGYELVEEVVECPVAVEEEWQSE